MYTPLSNSQRKVAPMKDPRGAPILGTFEVTPEVPNNRKFGCKKFLLIAVGGMGYRSEILSSGEIYDCESDKWTEIQRLPVDFGWLRCGVVCKDTFYVYSETRKLAGYDIKKGFWTKIQTNYPAQVDYSCTPKLLSCNGRLLLVLVTQCEIGTIGYGVRKLWELDLLSFTWKEVSLQMEDPRDKKAAFTADRNMIFGIQMFSEACSKITVKTFI